MVQSFAVSKTLLPRRRQLAHETLLAKYQLKYPRSQTVVTCELPGDPNRCSKLKLSSLPVLTKVFSERDDAV
jgi:hypothetical protein